MTTVASAWALRQRRLADSTAAAATAVWRRIDPADLTGSYAAEVGPALVRATTAGQLAAATGAQAYVGTTVAEQGEQPQPEGRVVPGAFAGTASDGRPLVSLFYWPVVGAKLRMRQGVSLPDALAWAERWLAGTVATQVLDAGRGAVGVAQVADTAIVGYERRMRGPTNCSRCAVLAGRLYRWNKGFLRHPGCDCYHQSLTQAAWDEAEGTAKAAAAPRRYFDSLTVAQQDKVFTVAGARAIRDGADVARVVNARRGMYTAGGRSYTTEGVTNRSRLGVTLPDRYTRQGVRIPGGRVRITPEQVYRDAADREDAIRLLKRFGYIV